MDTAAIRKAALDLGADVCGFAAVERFADAPAGFRPTDIFPGCKSVIVYGVALPKGLFAVPPTYIYSHFNANVSIPLTDNIGFRLARFLERDGAIAVPLPCDWPVESYDAETKTKRGILSMKHAAVAAGLGTLGKNTLLLNRTFGNRLTVGALLTDMALPSDPLTESVCLPHCTLCIDSCPMHTIIDGHVTQRPCREHTYVPDALGYATVRCNRCRAVCPRGLGEE